MDLKVNRFKVHGEGDIKYTYNNHLMAKDPETAIMNFLKALEKLQGYIEQEQRKIAELQKELPILQEVLSKTCRKEGRLSELKNEFAAIGLKIQLSIARENKEQYETNTPNVLQVNERLPARLKAN